jgi:outer membrane murein-binding lipoprotein Lpp
MSKDNAPDLIARADAQLAQDYVQIIRDLRDAQAEAERCDNPLRSEITCAMLVRDNDHLRKRVAELEAQQSSLREKIEALREAVPVGPFATHEHHARGKASLISYCSGLGAAYGNVLALLSDTETP